MYILFNVKHANTNYLVFKTGTYSLSSSCNFNLLSIKLKPFQQCGYFNQSAFKIVFHFICNIFVVNLLVFLYHMLRYIMVVMHCFYNSILFTTCLLWFSLTESLSSGFCKYRISLVKID